MQAFWKIKRPTLLLTQKHQALDKRLVSLVEEQLAIPLGKERIVYDAGSLQAFDLNGVVMEAASAEDIKLLKKYDYTGGLFGP